MGDRFERFTVPNHPPHMITLNENEQTLRELLLDVCNFIAAQPGQTKPRLRFTGGWVRDKLLGRESEDIDIGVDNMTGFAFGTFMKKYLDESEQKDKYGRSVLGHLAKITARPEKSKHLETLTTKVLGLEIDIVNLRKETYSEVSRTPTMEFGTPKEDALRRDATINALFYNLQSSEIEDLTGSGLRDLKEHCIRTPLPAYQTFKDDPLRILRLIRFSSRLNFQIAKDAEENMNRPDILEALKLKISRERIGDEIQKMLIGPSPCLALEVIWLHDLYTTVFCDPTLDKMPELSRSARFDECRLFLKSLLDGSQLSSEKTLLEDFGEKALALCIADEEEERGKVGELHTDRKLSSDSRGVLGNSGAAARKQVEGLGQTSQLEPLLTQRIFKTVLLKDHEAKFHAWMMCALAPWSLVQNVEQHLPQLKNKPSPPLEALIVRNGLKGTNKLVEMVANAVLHQRDIQSLVDSYFKELYTSDHAGSVDGKKRKHMNVENISRSKLGMAIRHWGPTWRAAVIFSMLHEIVRVSVDTNQWDAFPHLKKYERFLAKVVDWDLTEAHSFKPIVDGNTLRRAANRQAGPWMTRALEHVMEWQLDHPEGTAEESIAVTLSKI